MKHLTDSQTPDKPISQRILRNTLYNSLGVSCSVLVSLLLTPYIIHHIGIERFGIWAIVNVLIAYFGFLDFSLGIPVVKYVSEFYALKDFSRLNQLVNTAFVYYGALAMIVSISGLIFSSLILDFFTMPSALYQESLFVVRIGIISFSCFSIFSIFTSVLVGLQYMDITNKILIAGSIINVAGTVFVLKSGYGIRGLIINYLIVILISGILTTIMVFKKMPPMKFNPFDFKKAIFKKLFGFGTKLHLGKLAFLISFQTDKILLARFLNVSSVAFYEVGSKITFTMRRFSLLLVSALMPAASEISAVKNQSALYNFYFRSSKYLILASTPFFLFGIFNASLILKAWLGEGYADSAKIIQVLALGYFVNVLTAVASTIALGMGKPEFEMKYSLLVAPLNIALSIILILKIGLVGACIGTAISLVIGAVFLFRMFHNYISTPLRNFAYLLWKPMLASILSNLLVILLNYLPRFWIFMSPQIYSIVILLIKGIIFCVVYLVIIVAIKSFDKQDLDFVKQRLPIINRLVH